MTYVYALQRIKDGRWYTGACGDLRGRFRDHESGNVPSTRTRRPLHLVHYEACVCRTDAFRREKFLKTGRVKKYLRQRPKDWMAYAISQQVGTGQAEPTR